MGRKELPGPLPQGKERLVLDEATSLAGSDSALLTVDADTVIVSLYVKSVTGSIDVKVKTWGGDEENGSVDVITFPTISAPTTDLIIRKAATIMDRIEVEATYTGAADYQVRVRGVGTGEASVKILGANTATASQETVGTSATLLVPAALTDRAGLVLKNWTEGAVLYIGFTAAEATTGNGWPVVFGEAIGIDVAAGQEIYGVSDTAGTDVRLMEAGS